MPTEIRTSLLPALSAPEDFSGSVAVILDILRASSTICTALDAGAIAVTPCEEVEEALAIAEKLRAASEDHSSVLLGGERKGVLIEGFDLDNSPARYAAETVSGKQIIFTTSNGTRALKHALQARRILIGSFVCLDAVVNELKNEAGVVSLVCAGTDGAVTGEDCLCAGAIAAELLDQVDPDLVLDDSTRMAVDYYRTQVYQKTGLLAAMRASQGGRNLIQRGFEEDIQICSQRSVISTVPEYQHELGMITLAADV